MNDLKMIYYPDRSLTRVFKALDRARDALADAISEARHPADKGALESLYDDVIRVDALINCEREVFPDGN
jgi:hypothetical protein